MSDLWLATEACGQLWGPALGACAWGWNSMVFTAWQILDTWANGTSIYISLYYIHLWLGYSDVFGIPLLFQHWKEISTGNSKNWWETHLYSCTISLKPIYWSAPSDRGEAKREPTERGRVRYRHEEHDHWTTEQVVWYISYHFLPQHSHSFPFVFLMLKV